MNPNINDDNQLPELDAPTQHLIAMSKALGALKTENSQYLWRSNQHDELVKALEKRVGELESRNHTLERERDELRLEQVKWLKKTK
jgi:hypothetical protein